jgi:16S rRNA (uracil1498-N3)-methyltransferase
LGRLADIRFSAYLCVIRVIRGYTFSVHRFYIAPKDWNPDALLLRDAEVHHARDVLRLEPGERVVVFNGRGHEITAEITKVSRYAIQLRKLHQMRVPSLRCQIMLAQAIPKGKNMDLILQKAVELGAAEIAPIISDRTVVQLEPKEVAQKQAKWQQVAIEAAKQCGQNWLPTVQLPRKLREFFLTIEGAESPAGSFMPSAAPPLPQLRLIGSLQSDAVHLKTLLAEYEREHEGARPISVLMCIGPEGDFTPAELNLARSHGCRPITLGPIILRVETAAIYCLSVLSYELLTES